MHETTKAKDKSNQAHERDQRGSQSTYAHKSGHNLAIDSSATDANNCKSTQVYLSTKATITHPISVPIPILILGRVAYSRYRLRLSETFAWLWRTLLGFARVESSRVRVCFAQRNSSDQTAAKA